jgi:prepilin-type N-terminal cleavage/methylation domain-containing protein
MKKGFTLIELLVVVAIIGLLSAIVLASLSDARTKGVDASTRSNINNGRAQAELFYYNNNNLYTNVCTQNSSASADSSIKGIYTFIEAAARSYGGVIGTDALCGVSAAGTSWGMAAKLKVGTNQWYCVDSTGKAGTTTSVTAPINHSTAASSDTTC